MAGRGERALEMDVDDGIPFGLGHVREHPVAEDAGVVDDDVQIAEGVERRLHEPLGALEVGHALAVGDRLPTHRLDLGHDLLGR